MSRNDGARSFYFQVWLNCSTWEGVKTFEKHFIEKRVGTSQVEAWLTSWQMLQVYGDPELVEEMQKWCKAQTRVPKYRKHPRLPHLEKANQYACVIEDHRREVVEKVVQQGIAMEADLDAENGGDIVRRALGRSEEAFGTMRDDGADTVQPFSAPKLAICASAIPDAAAAAQSDDRAKKQAMENLAKAEQKAIEKQAKVEQRKLEQERQRVDRIAYAATPDGRAKTWLSGLQGTISKLESEIMHCKDSGSCDSPASIAAEYAATFASKVSGFKKTRTSIESVLEGTKQVVDFDATISKAEGDAKALKSEIQAYRTLERGYARARHV
jgi:hypothetical protein